MSDTARSLLFKGSQTSQRHPSQRYPSQSSLLRRVCSPLGTCRSNALIASVIRAQGLRCRAPPPSYLPPRPSHRFRELWAGIVVPRKDLEEWIKEVDTDGNRALDLGEFVNLVRLIIGVHNVYVFQEIVGFKARNGMQVPKIFRIPIRLANRPNPNATNPPRDTTPWTIVPRPLPLNRFRHGAESTEAGPPEPRP